MKKFTWFILLAAVLIAVYMGVMRVQSHIPSPEAKIGNPPSPTVKADGKDVKTYLGSHCWSSLGAARCVDSIGPAGLIEHRGAKPVPVEPGSAVTVEYGKKPHKGSMGVNLWISEGESKAVRLEENTFLAPEEAGTYVYDVFAHWDKGDASHAFVIEVK
ncbi:hypothetical protein [Peribacillus sp. SCS-155]|uniref:hypothetical protein n=1 Tax=Peribacillus sedimenti TaxID=3115297 RepID=UPI003906CAF5